MYFVRFAETEEYAKADLERGFSMVAANEDRDYLEELNGMSDDEYELIEHPFLAGFWALKIDGLCGYGPFATIADAREAAQAERENAGSDEPWKEGALVAIYTGKDAGTDGMAGDLFYPEALIEIMEG